jgi:hypothetical protein
MIIQKYLSANTIYITANEINTGVTSGVSMVLFNRATNVETTISGLSDSSIYPERVNIYTLSASSYSGLCTGKYSYKIKTSTDILVEEGIVDIREEILTPTQSVDNTYTFITGNSIDNNYLVFNCV